MASSSVALSTSSRPDSHDDCDLHHSPHEGYCYSLTNARKICKLRAKIETPGYLPACNLHAWLKQKSGHCQAVEDCGQLCNRLGSHNPPYHLCFKHDEGSNTLPCHILRLPTELRLMIFRYLFPEYVSHLAHAPQPKVAILKVNRQLYQEASAVLYQESRFEALVAYDSVRLQGKQWFRSPCNKKDDRDFSIDSMLSPISARRIKNLEVQVKIGEHYHRAPASIDSRGVTKEDYHLYATRDSVRKLVGLLVGQADTALEKQNALKRLKLTAAVHQAASWEPEETVFAIFVVLERFSALRGIENAELMVEAIGQSWATTADKSAEFADKLLNKKTFIQLRNRWVKTVQKPGPSVPMAKWKDPALATAYRKIEEFAQLMHNREAQGERPWPMGAFYDIRRPLHLARVAYERDDMDALKSIREAITIRWVNAQRHQQQSLQLMADSIDRMWDGDVDEDDEATSMKPSVLYRDAFEFGTEEPIAQTRKTSALWEELDATDWAPKIGSPGINVMTKGVLVRIEQKARNLQWIRLRTPAIIRQIWAAQKALEA